MTDHPSWAQPGCYGQALTYNEQIAECRSCPFAVSCKVDHLVALQTLREAHGITVRIKGEKIVKAPAPLKDASKAGAGLALPKKVEELLVRLERAGVRVSEGFAKGVNPFPKEAPRFLFITAHILLRLPQGVLRAELCQAFEQRLNWSRGTAAAHVTQAFQALIALGVAEESNGRLIMKR